MADGGLIITLPGFEVLDNPDPKNCAVHSDYLSPKIIPNTLTVTVNTTYLGTNTPSNTGFNYGTVDCTFTANPPAANTVLITIPHGLTYTPASWGFIKDFTQTPNALFPLPFTLGGSQGTIYYYTDSTNMYIKVNRASNSTNLTGNRYLFKYYIFVEDGA